jgi:hypothetical protein
MLRNQLHGIERQTETWVKNHQGFVVVLGRKKRSQPCSKRPQKAWFFDSQFSQTEKRSWWWQANTLVCKKRFNLLGTMKTGLAQNYLTVP